MKQKILYIITQAEFGGAQRYVYDLATNLGDDFDVAVAIGEIKGSDELARRLAAKNIRVIRLKHLVREISIWQDLSAICEIEKIIKKEKPEIVHLNSTKAGFVGSLAAWLAGKKFKLVYTIHGWIFLEPLSPARKRLYLALEKISARICDALIVLSQSELRAGLDKYICPPKKINLVPHGLTPPDFLPREIAREKLNIRPDEFCIGTIANFYPTKGLPYLIEAAAKLKNKNHSAKFLIMGDGIERAYLEALMTKYDLADNVILAGQITDAAAYLKAFDIFALPSLKEGLPYAILEAMNAGLAIVATSVGGIPEMIGNGRDGLLVPPKNSDELAGAIEKLIDSPEWRASLGKNAVETVKNKFNLAAMLEGTKKTYQK